MKRTILLTLIIVSSLNLLQANVITEGIEGFIKKISKMTKGKVDDVVRQIPKRSQSLSEIKSPKIKLPRKIKADPARLLLVEKSGQIISKGNFEKKFFQNQNFDNQLALIVQSSKYGDDYLGVARQVSHISPRTLSPSSPFAKYVHRNQLNEKMLQTKFIDTLNKTSKWGWEKMQKISVWVAQNKAISGASGALAWYVLDHESFDEAMKKSGKTLTEFLGSVVGGVAQGAGEAINEKIEQVGETVKQDVEQYMDETVQDVKVSALKSVSTLVGLFLFVLLLIIWRKRKVIYHFLTKADAIKVNKYKENDNEF